MNAIMAAIREVYGLFVEDGSYAFFILFWIVVAALLFPHLSVGVTWRAPLFFIGLIVLLLENVYRTARSHRK